MKTEAFFWHARATGIWRREGLTDWEAPVGHRVRSDRFLFSLRSCTRIAKLCMGGTAASQSLCMSVDSYQVALSGAPRGRGQRWDHQLDGSFVYAD